MMDVVLYTAARLVLVVGLTAVIYYAARIIGVHDFPYSGGTVLRDCPGCPSASGCSVRCGTATAEHRGRRRATPERSRAFFRLACAAIAPTITGFHVQGLLVRQIVVGLALVIALAGCARQVQGVLSSETPARTTSGNLSTT